MNRSPRAAGLCVCLLCASTCVCVCVCVCVRVCACRACVCVCVYVRACPCVPFLPPHICVRLKKKYFFVLEPWIDEVG